MANKKKISVRHRTRPVAITPSSGAQGETTSASQVPTDDGSGAYEVGYGKPPVSTRFKSGKSGNSKGRPKGVKNLKTDLAEEMQERVQVSEGSKTQTVSKQRAMVKRLTEMALKGDPKAITLLINLAVRLFDQTEEVDGADRATKPTLADLEIIQDFEAHIRATNPSKE